MSYLQLIYYLNNCSYHCLPESEEDPRLLREKKEKKIHEKVRKTKLDVRASIPLPAASLSRSFPGCEAAALPSELTTSGPRS